MNACWSAAAPVADCSRFQQYDRDVNVEARVRQHPHLVHTAIKLLQLGATADHRLLLRAYSAGEQHPRQDFAFQYNCLKCTTLYMPYLI